MAKVGIPFTDLAGFCPTRKTNDRVIWRWCDGDRLFGEPVEEQTAGLRAAVFLRAAGLRAAVFLRAAGLRAAVFLRAVVFLAAAMLPSLRVSRGSKTPCVSGADAPVHSSRPTRRSVRRGGGRS